ncbi:MAG TPA: PAS domain S-box protein [Aromatoleum sp.]|uniref:sensor histidine kinase n=1 Tax=Aromatoleum sp. TaxID=2307007 RepID=UPI002B45DE49|nr:PAS domain S-box protein [Aromatoleum sp.]HJV28374.1 PAS domain S-box protein [Aromatoleum sp.]
MSLHRFLARLIWLCVLPLVFLAAYLAIDSVRSAQLQRDARADRLARNVVTAIDEDLNARMAALQMLAASPLADDASRWEDFYREALGFYRSFGSHVILADQQLQMRFNTRNPFGTPLPALPVPKGRSAARTALTTAAPAVGDTFVGPVARVPMVAIAVPALRGEQPVALVLSVFEARQMQERLDRVVLPEGWALTLRDSVGTTIAARSPPGFDAAADVDPAGRVAIASTVAPWSLVLEVPRAIRRAPFVQAAVVLALAVLGATLASVAGGSLAGRRLARDIASLVAPSARTSNLPAIREIAAVRALLDEAHGRRETAEAALRDSEQRFRATFEQAAVGIALVTPQGGWLRTNQKLCDIVGYTQEELAALTFQDITHPDDLTADLGQLQRMLAGEIETYSMEKRYLRKAGGLVWVNLTVALVRRADGRPDYFISVVEDIQRRKEAEIALQELNASLEQRVALRTAELTAANQELDSFAYAVSHDLRAPLRAMSGFSNALAEDYGDRLDGEAKLYLDQIDIASRKMGELIEGLLALSRSTRGELKREQVDVTAIAQATLAALAHSEPGRVVDATVEPGLTVCGGARMTEAVLDNLIGNAWKYSAKSPSAKIRVYRGELDGKPCVCISDNGAGFDMAHADQLFQPFRRLHRHDEFPGIGIGLATVQRIVQRYGGAIRAHSAVGEGATFCFRLADEDEAA